MNPVLLRALVVFTCLNAELLNGMPYSDRPLAFADRIVMKLASKDSLAPQPRTRSLPDHSPAINIHASTSPKLNGKESIALPNKGLGNRQMSAMSFSTELVTTESPPDVRRVTLNIKTLPGYWIKDPSALLNDTFGADGADYRTEVYHIDDLVKLAIEP